MMPVREIYVMECIAEKIQNIKKYIYKKKKKRIKHDT